MHDFLFRQAGINLRQEILIGKLLLAILNLHLHDLLLLVLLWNLLCKLVVLDSDVSCNKDEFVVQLTDALYACYSLHLTHVTSSSGVLCGKLGSLTWLQHA